MKDRHNRLGRRAAILTVSGLVASLLAACSSTPASSDTTVDLTYTNKGRLTGRFAGQTVDVSSELPSGKGKAIGTFAGEPVAANWQTAYNGEASQRVVPVTLDGSFAKQSVLLSATFRLKPNYLFDSGIVTGTSHTKPVHADVTSAAGESSSSVNVDGSFSGAAFSLYATIAGDLRSGLIRGNVGGKPTQLTAKVQSGVIRVTGDYSGPAALLVLAIGSLLYFLGGIYSI